MQRYVIVAKHKGYFCDYRRRLPFFRRRPSFSLNALPHEGKVKLFTSYAEGMTYIADHKADLPTSAHVEAQEVAP